MNTSRGLPRVQSRGFISLGLILAVVIGLAVLGGAGWYATRSSNETLQILEPRGGETFTICNTYPVRWTGGPVEANMAYMSTVRSDGVEEIVKNTLQREDTWTLGDSRGCNGGGTIDPGEYKIRIKIPKIECVPIEWIGVGEGDPDARQCAPDHLWVADSGWFTVTATTKTDWNKSSEVSVETLSFNPPLLTYRIQGIPKDVWLRIIDVPSDLAMWGTEEVIAGTHELDTTTLVPYEGVKITLPAGEYRLRLEQFVASKSVVVSESQTFTIPGKVVAVPTCEISMTPSESQLKTGSNSVTLAWSSQNAVEAYVDHSPPMGGNSTRLSATRGKKVSLNGSEAVNIFSGPGYVMESYWLFVKNSRGATVCLPDGTTYFSPNEVLENPPVIG